MLGFAPYPWAQSLLDIPAAVRLVQKAAANAHIVLVTATGVEILTDGVTARPWAV